MTTWSLRSEGCGAAVAGCRAGRARSGAGAHGACDEGAGGGPLPITSTRMGCLLDSLERAYRVLGLEDAAGGDEVFLQMVLARIIEPGQQARQPASAGGGGRRGGLLPDRHAPAACLCEGVVAAEGIRRCAAHAELGPASLVLYDVSTLYFETDATCRPGPSTTASATPSKPTLRSCLPPSR